MNTYEALEAMFKQNTGTSILDSGSAYGRHWERNQGRDFSKSEPFTVSEYGVEVDSFTYCLDSLQFSPEWDAEFKRYAEQYPDEHWLGLMETFVEELEGRGALPFNTYNWETDLNQTLQGVMFKRNGRDYVILQVHGGCDVRGGYSDPKVFEIVDECFPYAPSWYLTCEGEGHGVAGGSGEITVDGCYSPDYYGKLEESKWSKCPECGSELKA